MYIPFPPKSCGQIITVGALPMVRPFDFNSGNRHGLKVWVACIEMFHHLQWFPRASTVQTEKINFPPGFTLPGHMRQQFLLHFGEFAHVFAVVVQRACGLRCQVPSPLHGASTRMPSNFVFVGSFAPPSHGAAR
jgi:hypothetical protein